MAEMPSADNLDTTAATTQHKDAVSLISAQVSTFHAAKTPFRIYHGTTNSTRQSDRTRNATVDISPLTNILSISKTNRTCLVEPNVPMDKLVQATLQHGLVPPVVPEFPGITVGGGFAGTAGESSSFKHGFFDKAIVWVEVVLADGEVVMASKDERADLFHGLAGTFGTLGVVTLFEMRLVPAKEFVEVRYIRVGGIEEAQEVIRWATREKEVDFLDGVMFSPDRGVVMSGRFVDRDAGNNDLPIVTFTGAWDQWFYLHAEERMNQNVSTSNTACASRSLPLLSDPAFPRDLIPLVDYLFRYDRGAFWTGRFAFTYFFIPFIRPIRWLGDYWMHTRIMYHALHRSGLYQRLIIQDMALPNRHMPEFSRWLDTELPHVYPRWLCPLKPGGGVGMNPHSKNQSPVGFSEVGGSVQAKTNAKEGDDEDSTLLNIGVWGETPPQHLQVTINRLIEGKLESLSGMKWLYAQCFYTEDEFWDIYNKKWYDRLRKKYKADGYIPSVYEKIVTKGIFEEEVAEEVKGDGDDGKVVVRRRDARLPVEWGIWNIWPFAGVYGVLSALKGGDYLRKQH